MDFRTGLSNFEGVKFTTEVTRNGENYHGLGGVLTKHDTAKLYRIITELTSQGRRDEQPFLKLKKHLNKNHDLQLWLGISTMPEWLKDIVLTDAPGTGSIDESHEIIISKIIPESQLVLFLIESAKAGSAIDKRFCDRISNTYHRKVFYILNKIDQQNPDEQADALDLAKRSVPEIDPNGGKRPEFLSVAGLYAYMAHEVAKGKRSLEDLVEHSKINLTHLLISPEWAKADETSRQRLLTDFLSESSKFQALRNRIEEYLKYENKELAIAQVANSIIAKLADTLGRNCERSIQLLNSDQSIETLEQKAKELQRLRLGYQHEAECILQDYLDSALDSKTGLREAVKGLLAPVPSQIAEKLIEALNGDKEIYKKLQKKENLQEWLKTELRYCVEDVQREIDSELTKRSAHVLEQLGHILQKLDASSLAKAIDIEIKGNVSSAADPTASIIGTTVGGGALGAAATAALAFLGVGSTTGTVILAPATGAVAAVAGTWLSPLAPVLAWMGMGTAAETATVATAFWGLGVTGFAIPIVGLTLVAGALVGLLIFNKKWKIEKITEQSKKMLEKIVILGGSIDGTQIDPVADVMYRKYKDSITRFADAMKNGVAQRVQQMKGEEAVQLEQVKQGKTVKAEKVARIKEIKLLVEQMGNEALTALKKTAEAK